MVDTADRVFELRLRTEQNSASVVVDGRVVCHLDESLRVRIARADSVFQLISVPVMTIIKRCETNLVGVVGRGLRNSLYDHASCEPPALLD